MKILVTGGAGFIASHIVDRYIDLGHTVIVVDNLSTGKKSFLNSKARFYNVDIRDRSEIDSIFQKEKPEVLNHHAAQISVRNSVGNPLYDADVNIIGLLNIIEAGRTNNLQKIVFASSGGVVYGDKAPLPTPENYEPKTPISPYGISKFTSEMYLNFYYQNYNLPYVALRYANIYGPRQNPHGEAGVVAIFNLKLLKGQVPTINGDGKQTRDYVYVSDVVDANVKALETKNIGAFNIGTSFETDVNQLYKKIANIAGSQISPNHGPLKKGEQKRSCLENLFAQKQLNWQPKTNLDQGLKLTYQYFLSNFQNEN